jgi:hypothetical protein
MTISLWHDDVRPAPDGWLWVKTNNEAKTILSRAIVEECSLDHDLGAVPTGDMDPTEVVYLRGTGEETGLHLVEWMIETGNVPPFVKIHSWNPDGAKRMAQTFADSGYVALIAPFVMPTSTIG